MLSFRRTLLCTTVLIANTFSVYPSYAQSLENLGTVNGGPFSDATGMSSDGLTVVGGGFNGNGDFEAFIWTQTGGMVGLGDLAGGNFSSLANAVNADGSVVVGGSNGANGGEAFRWTLGTGMVGLGFLPGSVIGSQANDVNADGSVVVGGCDSASGYQAFRWTQGSGMVGLGILAGGNFSSARGVNADGSVVVGESETVTSTEAFRWTQGGGMVGLGFLLGGGTNSGAYDVSADGSVVVGASDSAGGYQAFRWTQGSGMVGLGFLQGGSESEAKAINADGSVIVGEAHNAGGDDLAFQWTQADGMRAVIDILADAGVDVTNWILEEANGVNADGNIITGSGEFNGDAVAWLANIATGGLTAPEALSESLNTAAEMGSHAVGASMQYMPQGVFIAQNIRDIAVPVRTSSNPYRMAYADDPSSIEPAAGGYMADNGLSMFVMGSYGRDGSPDNDQFAGTIGLNKEVTSDIDVGIGFVAGRSSTDFNFESESDLDALGGMMLVSYHPGNSGLRIYGTAYVADLSLDTKRGYLNGAALDFSNGETDGSGYGTAIRAGWVENVNHLGTTIMPYVEARYAKTKLDGYTETDGAFAASFTDQEHDHLSARLGAEWEHPVNKKVRVIFRPALAHRFSDDGDGFIADVGGVVTQTLDSDAGDRNWAEATIGADWQATDKIHLSTELTGRTGDSSEPAASLLVGAFVKF